MDKFDNNENVAKSYALRLLVHYVGDLVQPLHCENRYDTEFPEGDTGANDFPLKYHYDVDELHALWDKIIYDGYHNIDRPFTNETWDDFQPQVTIRRASRKSPSTRLRIMPAGPKSLLTSQCRSTLVSPRMRLFLKTTSTLGSLLPIRD